MHLAESNSAHNSVPVFMYLEGVLIYVFASSGGQYNSVATTLGVSHNSVLRSIRTGALFLGTFLFTTSPIDPNAEPTMNETELKKLYTEVRNEYTINNVSQIAGGKAKAATAKTPAVKVTRLSDGAVFKCDNYRATRT